jgi:hypothetical protein
MMTQSHQLLLKDFVHAIQKGKDFLSKAENKSRKLPLAFATFAFVLLSSLLNFGQKKDKSKRTK